MKPTINQIREGCSEESYERGLRYFKQGRVTGIEQFGSTITAKVSGTDDYRVTIRLDEKDFKASCTCPYDWGGYCKHIVATLLALTTDSCKINQKGKKQKQKVEKILSNISLDDLKNFLMSEFEENRILKEHFTIHFSGKSSATRSIRDYKKEINLLYREMAEHDGYIRYGRDVDFSYIQGIAERYRRIKNFLEAGAIYQALSEVIAEHMERVDDSDGYYGGKFAYAIENLVECIIDARLDHREKKKHISYHFNKYMKNDPDFFQEYHNYALKLICQSKEDLNYWKNLLKPYIPENLPPPDQWSLHYQAKGLLMMQLHILDNLNDKVGFYDLIERYYKRDDEFCLRYVQRLEKDHKTDEAVRVAEEGLNLFPDHLNKELRRFLCKFYEKQSSEYKKNLAVLFLLDKDWNDYKTLKKACSPEEWEQMLSFLIGSLSKTRFGEADTIILICLKEEMFDQALKNVLLLQSLPALAHYHEELARKYPEEYFTAYRELIVPFADSKTGRSHYQEIAGYLSQMKQINGFANEYRELVNLLKSKYANRPAFLDEMKGM